MLSDSRCIAILAAVLCHCQHSASRHLYVRDPCSCTYAVHLMAWHVSVSLGIGMVHARSSVQPIPVGVGSTATPYYSDLYRWGHAQNLICTGLETFKHPNPLSWQAVWHLGSDFRATACLQWWMLHGCGQVPISHSLPCNVDGQWHL